MQQHSDNTHIGQLTIVLHQRAADSSHQVATEETEFSLLVNGLQRPHQVGGMQVARGFAGYEIVFHRGRN